MREFCVSNHLRTRLEEKKVDRRGVIIAGLFVLLLSIIPSILLSPWFLAGGWAVFLIILAGAMSSDTEKIVLENGIKGEDILKNRLKRILSDEYVGFFGLPLPGGGDIDCFLIGPTGAYIFEVKYHKGYILYCDGEWTQIKVGKNGKVYEGSHMRKPVSQVMRGINEIKKYLRSNGINLWIEGVIVFSNPEVMVFPESTYGLKVVKIDELEMVFHGGKSYINPEGVELISSLVYGGFSPQKEVSSRG